MKFDPEAKKVSLSLKHALPDPWIEHAEKLVEGQQAHRASRQGHAELPARRDRPGRSRDGAEGRIRADELSTVPGEEVEVTLLTINSATRRITGSIQHVADIPSEELADLGVEGDVVAALEAVTE